MQNRRSVICINSEQKTDIDEVSHINDRNTVKFTEHIAKHQTFLTLTGGSEYNKNYMIDTQGK